MPHHERKVMVAKVTRRITTVRSAAELLRIFANREGITLGCYRYDPDLKTYERKEIAPHVSRGNDMEFVLLEDVEALIGATSIVVFDANVHTRRRKPRKDGTKRDDHDDPSRHPKYYTSGVIFSDS